MEKGYYRKDVEEAEQTAEKRKKSVVELLSDIASDPEGYGLRKEEIARATAKYEEAKNTLRKMIDAGHEEAIELNRIHDELVSNAYSKLYDATYALERLDNFRTELGLKFKGLGAKHGAYSIE